MDSPDNQKKNYQKKLRDSLSKLVEMTNSYNNRIFEIRSRELDKYYHKEKTKSKWTE